MFKWMFIINVQSPPTLTSIGESAFSKTNISTITIPEGIKSLCRNCFGGCTSLTSIQLPSSLEDISDKVFLGTGLKQVEVPKKCKIQ